MKVSTDIARAMIWQRKRACYAARAMMFMESGDYGLARGMQHYAAEAQKQVMRFMGLA